MNEDTDDLIFVETFDYENDKIESRLHIFKAVHPELAKFSDSEETFVRDLKMFVFEDALGLRLLPMTRVILERGLLSHE